MPTPAPDDEKARLARKQKVFRACMLGLMAGSGVFLALRYALNLGVDPSLVAATGVGVAVGMFLLQQVEQ